MDKVLDELQKMNATLSALEAAQDDEGTDASAAQTAEAEAQAHEQEGARHREAAARAREDDDAEEASREDALAAGCMTKAFKAYMQASTHHTALAARARANADEEAATAADAQATRLEAAAQAAKKEEDAAAQRAESVAAKEDDEDAMGKMFAMFMRTRKDAEAAQDADQDEMAAAFYAGIKAAMQGMTFHPGMARRKSAEAAHDDEDEDKALIQRMLRQKGMKASTGADLQTKRALRQLTAQVELLTDNVKKMTGLLTDAVQPRGLSTDKGGAQPNGGPAPTRRSMAGAGDGVWIDKYADRRNGGTNGLKSIADATAELKAEGVTDPTQQIARIVAMQQRGECALQ